jgi:hypothetical protein
VKFELKAFAHLGYGKLILILKMRDKGAKLVKEHLSLSFLTISSV